MDSFINVGLIKEPYNWATVFLMCAFALIFLNLIAPTLSDGD
jgi:hypothetical protein